MTNTARRMWTLFEPVHGAIYFSDEGRAAGNNAGYKGYWMAYFAFRMAPLGAIGPAVATAACYGFHPSRVARALPDAWDYATPDRALEARLQGAEAVLARVWGEATGSRQLAEAADLAWEASQAADTAGRIIGAANQALPRPDRPHLALWQASTTLREHRGDGHNAALLAAGVGPVHGHILKAAADETDVATLKTARNWGDDAWEAATAELRQRGWIDANGRLTEAGTAVRVAVERQTDQAASLPWRTLGTARTERLAELLQPLTQALIGSGVFPVPNPIGITPA